MQTHEALPARITYSSSQNSARLWGGGSIHSKSPAFDFFSSLFFGGGGGGVLALFQARVTRALSAPVGVGPPFPWTPISPLTGTWSEVKSGRGRARSNWGLAHHVMARRRLRSLRSLIMKMP